MTRFLWSLGIAHLSIASMLKIEIEDSNKKFQSLKKY